MTEERARVTTAVSLISFCSLSVQDATLGAGKDTEEAFIESSCIALEQTKKSSLFLSTYHTSFDGMQTCRRSFAWLQCLTHPSRRTFVR